MTRQAMDWLLTFTEYRWNDTIEEEHPFPRSMWGAYADVAQLVEQLIRNQQVIGSSPIVGSTSKKWDKQIE